MDADRLESLLRENECSFLDFKRDQYPFANAADFQKAELLKDIIALANQEVARNGYIIIGADENRGARAIVFGTQAHLDEHSVQQFVNSKTNRPVAFRYTVVPCDGVTLGIIEVNSQPFIFLKNDFGPLRKHVCYVRLGSSTAELDPEEVARRVEKRAKAQQSPTLSFGFAEIRRDYVIFGPNENRIIPAGEVLKAVALALPKGQFPQRSQLRTVAPGKLEFPFTIADEFDFEKFGEFLETAHLIRPVGLFIENSSQVAAINLKIQISTTENSELHIWPQKRYPPCPTGKRGRFHGGECMMILSDGDIEVKTLNGKTNLTWQVPKIVPGEKLFSEGTFLVLPRSVPQKAVFRWRVVGENLPQPIEHVDELLFDRDKKEMSIEEMTSLVHVFKRRQSPF